MPHIWHQTCHENETQGLLKHLRHEGALGATKALEGVVAVPWKYYESNVHERPYGSWTFDS